MVHDHPQVGSHLLALAAAAYGVPVYAVADASKVSGGPLVSLVHPVPPQASPVLEEKDVHEVTAAWPPGDTTKLHVRNIYFETVPWKVVTGGVITDTGVVQQASVQQQLEEKGASALRCMLV